MKFSILILERARSDINEFRTWIATKSPQGAAAWYLALCAAVQLLRHNADRYGQAPESSDLGRDTRQAFFRTRRGRSYRLIYTIVGKEVRILRVRGPGQAPLSDDDIRE
jgi:plasmid stabilization system protein ParE